uniref:Autophagy protein 5 n=1 Tax=Panagrellus redivivus TaxID=6233 RepID=A0A7E4ZW90_PANRE
MSDDYEVKRTIWDGKIPVEFALDPSEFSYRSTQSHFMMVPRVSYFTLVLMKALKHFESSIDELNDSDEIKDAWLEFNGIPLRMHYPIGVLFDVHSKDGVLPWVVTVRFKNFPDTLVRCTTIDTMRHYFLQTVKEADQLKHKGAIMSAMSAQEHAQLFDSIRRDDFNDFWQVNKKLNENTDPKVIHIPIRFYYADLPFRQVLISTEPNPESETAADLSSAFKKVFPNLSIDEYNLISHGIHVPTDSPVLWLSSNFAYPDNFVHVVVRPKNDD